MIVCNTAMIMQVQHHVSCQLSLFVIDQGLPYRTASSASAPMTSSYQSNAQDEKDLAFVRAAALHISQRHSEPL